LNNIKKKSDKEAANSPIKEIQNKMVIELEDKSFTKQAYVD